MAISEAQKAWWKTPKGRAAQKRANNTPAAKARTAACKVRFRERNRAFLRDYKLARGCSDCGYKTHPEALDFDHRPGVDKRMAVGVLAQRGGSLDALMDEIEKCDVVCANCHRVRTANRRT